MIGHLRTRLTATMSPLVALLPLWIFVFIFKFGAALHYTLLAPLGERILPLWIVGLIMGASSLVQLILDVPAGFILDRLGYVKMLTFGTAMFIFAGLAMVFGFHTPAYLISVLLATVGWLFYGPGVSAYVLSEVPRERAGEYFGILHASQALGVVGATAILSLVLHFSMAWIGVLISGLMLLALVSLSAVLPEHQRIHEKKMAHQTYYVRRHFIDHVLRVFHRLNPASTMLILQNISSSLFYGVVWFTVPLIIANALYSGFPSVGLGVFDLAVVLLGSFLGRLADTVSKKLLVLVGLLMFSVTAMSLGFNFSVWFLLLGFLATAGDEMSNVSLWAWLDDLDKDHQDDGLINGAVSVFEDLGWTIGPVAAGFLFLAIGPSYTILVGAIPLFLTWCVALILIQFHAPAAARVRSVDHHIPRRLRHKR